MAHFKKITCRHVKAEIRKNDARCHCKRRSTNAALRVVQKYDLFLTCPTRKTFLPLLPFLFKNGPFPASFCYLHSFHIPIQMTNIQFEQYKLEKHRWCAWDPNPGWQDGRRRRIHGATAVPQLVLFWIEETAWDMGHQDGRRRRIH